VLLELVKSAYDGGLGTMALTKDSSTAPAFCPNCGTAVGGGSKFCAGCGAPVTSSTLGSERARGRGRPTTFEFRADILSDIWLNYRDDDMFADFIAYNDLGLPLAYAVSEEIVPETDKARKFIDESFAQLLTILKIDDSGFETVDEMLGLD